jgi:hypothetical protein
MDLVHFTLSNSHNYITITLVDPKLRLCFSNNFNFYIKSVYLLFLLRQVALSLIVKRKRCIYVKLLLILLVVACN